MNNELRFCFDNKDVIECYSKLPDEFQKEIKNLIKEIKEKTNRNFQVKSIEVQNNRIAVEINYSISISM